MSGTVVFFKAMAPVLIANALTVVFVDSVAKINQLEQNRRGSGASHLSPAAYLVLKVANSNYVRPSAPIANHRTLEQATEVPQRAIGKPLLGGKMDRDPSSLDLERIKKKTALKDGLGSREVGGWG
jgi:hypothetical protein